MIYTVKVKQDALPEQLRHKGKQIILRVCTTEDEALKLKSDGTKVARRDCEYYPICQSQNEAEQYAYRPIQCEGLQVPRIFCKWHNGRFVLRSVGRNNSSIQAYLRCKSEDATEAGRLSSRRTNDALRDEHRVYRDLHKDRIRMYSHAYYQAHKDEQQEYDRRRYKENRDKILERQKCRRQANRIKTKTN